MAHWQHAPEREDGDGHNETIEDAAKARRWLRKQVSKNMLRDPLYGALADLELAAGRYNLPNDYDEDLDDVDEMGPY